MLHSGIHHLSTPNTAQSSTSFNSENDICPALSRPDLTQAAEKKGH